MKKPKPRPILAAEVAALQAKLAETIKLTETDGLSAAARRAVNGQLRKLIGDLEASLSSFDPVTHPTSIFDPSNPKIIGRFTALALVAQSRVALSDVGRFYGSGIYAIYYSGDFPTYSPLAGSETPIYVGKAGPATAGARTAHEQGERLWSRLNEHRKNIVKAVSTLKGEDFHARFLVVQSGWETAAESYLIHLFQPIWNKEVKILYGLGKHGDDPETRANKRSPWDTLHPARAWAVDTKADARSQERISDDVRNHFERHPVFGNTTELLEAFFAELRQS